LKAGTPSETASTPVSAAHPDANARRSRKRPMPSSPGACGSYGCSGRKSKIAPRAPYHDEQVRRRREELAGFADAAEVRERDEHHRRHAEPYAIAEQHGERGGDGRDAGGHAHRHRQHVVDQQRGGADQPGNDAEVVLRDDVRAAAARVREDRLAVRRDDDRDEGGDAHADRQRVAQRGRAREDQHEQDFLGRVGDGGERVGGEDRKRDGLAEALVA
jgi:hypothetical protein